ncbi:hypothetical protein Ciccas_013440, partial [Cichlidogyrus casuarinus]
MNEDNEQERYEMEQKLAKAKDEAVIERQKCKEKLVAMEKASKQSKELSHWKTTADKKSQELTQLLTLSNSLEKELQLSKEREAVKEEELLKLTAETSALKLIVGQRDQELQDESNLLKRLQAENASAKENLLLEARQQSQQFEQVLDKARADHEQTMARLLKGQEAELLKLRAEMSEQRSTILEKCDKEKNKIVADLKEVYTEHVRDLQASMQLKEEELAKRKDELARLKSEFEQSSQKQQEKYKANLEEVVKNCEKSQTCKWEIEFDELKREANEVIDTMKVELTEERRQLTDAEAQIRNLQDDYEKELANREEELKEQTDQFQEELAKQQNAENDWVSEFKSKIGSAIAVLEDTATSEFENSMLNNSQLVRSTLVELKKLAQNANGDDGPHKLTSNQASGVSDASLPNEEEMDPYEEGALTPRPSPQCSQRNSQNAAAGSPYSVLVSSPRMRQQLLNNRSCSNATQQSDVTFMLDWKLEGSTISDLIDCAASKLQDLARTIISSYFKQVTLRFEQQSHRIVQHTHRLMINVADNSSRATKISLHDDLRTFKEDLLK